MPSFIRQGASVTASVLETAAGLLRKLAETEEASQRAEKPAPSAEKRTADAPAPAAAPTQSAEPASKQRPAPATRSRISNPKAARKVRSRQG
jgi:hypothetical protein